MYWARENGWEFLPIRTGRNSRVGKSILSVSRAHGNED